MQGKYKIREERWSNVSKSAVSFVKNLLVVDPHKRMSAEECLKHPWLAPEVVDPTSDSELSRVSPSPRRTSSKMSSASTVVSAEEIICDLQEYSKCSHLKRAALAMIAHHLNGSDLDEIRKAFLALDLNHNGTITKDIFRKVMRGQESKVGSMQELDRLFDCADTAHDGELHYSEFAAALMQSRVTLTQDRCREAFALFDVSRTGRITDQDMKVVLGGDMFEDADISTLIKECGGCTPKTGIPFESFYKHLRDAHDPFGLAEAASAEEEVTPADAGALVDSRIETDKKLTVIAL
jgi:calcium-dependent protein kinase